MLWLTDSPILRFSFFLMVDSPLIVIVRGVVVVGCQARGAGIDVEVTEGWGKVDELGTRVKNIKI